MTGLCIWGPMRFWWVVPILLLWATPSVAAIPTIPPQACPLVAEWAVGIRAMAVERLSGEAIYRVMDAWYAVEERFSPAGKDLVRALIRVAQTDARPPQAFSRAFLVSCQAGEQARFLGVSV
ncbi:MAG: hypothetical protein IT514_15515 [Burkholderiales bacterium]|nr:hypothetical protein [Burkholderiales bacterium]